jgi:hypothetical protein
MSKKTLLNKTHREIIQHYGVLHIRQSVNRTRESKLLQTLADAANKALREKYPEADMTVLRKYKLTRTDLCLRFHFPSGRVDGFSFKNDDGIVDVPRTGGCGYSSNDVFPVLAAFEKAFDNHAAMKKENDKLEAEKIKSFMAFLTACRYVEEVLDVIDLPGDIRERLGQRSTGLVAVTPETVATLKKTFRLAA